MTNIIHDKKYSRFEPPSFMKSFQNENRNVITTENNPTSVSCLFQTLNSIHTVYFCFLLTEQIAGVRCNGTFALSVPSKYFMHRWTYSGPKLWRSTDHPVCKRIIRSTNIQSFVDNKSLCVNLSFRSVMTFYGLFGSMVEDLWLMSMFRYLYIK